MQFTKKLVVITAVALVASHVAAVDMNEASCKCVPVTESSWVPTNTAAPTFFPQGCKAEGVDGTDYVCTFEKNGAQEGFIGWFCRRLSKNWSCGLL